MIITVSAFDYSAVSVRTRKVRPGHDDAPRCRRRSKVVDRHPRLVGKNRVARRAIDDCGRGKVLTAVERPAEQNRAVVEIGIGRPFGREENCSAEINARHRIGIAIILAAGGRRQIRNQCPRPIHTAITGD